MTAKEIVNMEYSMKVYPINLENGKTEWCVEFPDLPGCVGGGDTVEEAIKDAEESQKVYLSFLASENKPIPKPSVEDDLPSGKIS